MHFPASHEYDPNRLFPKNPDGSHRLNDKVTFHDAWAEMEKALESGKARAIGVSNFSVKT